jgi:hypothetical protein
MRPKERGMVTSDSVADEGIGCELDAGEELPTLRVDDIAVAFPSLATTDPRHRALEQFVNHFNRVSRAAPRSLASMPLDGHLTLVSACNTGWIASDLDAATLLEIQRVILDDQDRALRSYAELITRRFIATLSLDMATGSWPQVLTIVSIGVGEGRKEEALDSLIQEMLAGHSLENRVRLQWFGLDRWPSKSLGKLFVPGATFKRADCERLETFRPQGVTSPFFTMANYSVHHMRVTPKMFVQRSQGAERAFLLEEPTRARDWDSPTYRVLRIAYDLLGNAAFFPAIFETVRRNPKVFYVSYWTDEAIADEKPEVVELSDQMPRTVLIDMPIPRSS